MTQVFFDGDPYLDDDTIGAVKEALVRAPDRRDDGALATEFDIKLRPAS